MRAEQFMFVNSSGIWDEKAPSGCSCCCPLLDSGFVVNSNNYGILGEDFASKMTSRLGVK